MEPYYPPLGVCKFTEGVFGTIGPQQRLLVSIGRMRRAGAAWWRHDMEKLFTLLARSERKPLFSNGPLIAEQHCGFFDVFFVELPMIWDASTLVWRYCNGARLQLPLLHSSCENVDVGGVIIVSNNSGSIELYWEQQGTVSILSSRLNSVRTPIVKTISSHGRLIFIMRIYIFRKTVFRADTGPGTFHT